MITEARRTKPPEWFTIDEFNRLRSEGYKMERIAEMVFASPPLLRRWLNEMGVPKQRSGRKAYDEVL